MQMRRLSRFPYSALAQQLPQRLFGAPRHASPLSNCSSIHVYRLKPRIVQRLTVKAESALTLLAFRMRVHSGQMRSMSCSKSLRSCDFSYNSGVVILFLRSTRSQTRSETTGACRNPRHGLWESSHSDVDKRRCGRENK